MKTQDVICEETQLRCVLSLRGSSIESRDGEPCGKSRDFLFDDENWTIRYVSVDTGGFFSRHEILLSPSVLEDPKFGFHSENIRTVLSKDLIDASPPLEEHAPVSRQYELELARHYGYSQ